MKQSWRNSIASFVAGFDYFSLGSSFVLYYVLTYGLLPFLTYVHAPLDLVRYIVVTQAYASYWRPVGYLLLGLFAFLAGYIASRRMRRVSQCAAVFRMAWREENVPTIFFSVFVASVAVKAIQIFYDGYFHLDRDPVFAHNPFYSLIGLFNWLGLIALAIAFTYYFSLLRKNDPRYKTWQMIAWGVFMVEFLYGFFSKSGGAAATPILVYLIIKHYLVGRSYRRVAIAAVFILFVLVPVLNLYKMPGNLFTAHPAFREAKTTTVLAGVRGGHRYSAKAAAVRQYVFDSSFGRIDQSRIVFGIFDRVHNFWYGKSLVKFFVSLGPPRFLWKDKPMIQTDGNELGREIGVLAPSDFGTVISATMIGDWYLNFGLAGIILGMFLVGVLLRVMNDALVGQGAVSLSGVMMYGVVWLQVVTGIENWIAPVYAGLVKLLVILFVIHFLLVTPFPKGIFRWRRA